ncbi:MAG: nucleotidyl transferase AbiEii/AbiGii toxin family protein [Actinomycetota bacterium]
MGQRFYESVLYPLQDEILLLIGSLDTEFYLSGGTAASRGYLHHRYSDDLDLFVNDDERFGLWSDRIIAALQNHWDVRISVREQRFVRLELTANETSMKIEMINDVPSHVGLITVDPVLGRLDSAENILANKITALVSRSEPKDLADVWGFCKRLALSISNSLEPASSKAAGLFPADIARVLIAASESDWSLVKWVEAPPVDAFLSDLRELGESLLLGPIS